MLAVGKCLWYNARLCSYLFSLIFSSLRFSAEIDEPSGTFSLDGSPILAQRIEEEDESEEKSGTECVVSA